MGPRGLELIARDELRSRLSAAGISRVDRVPASRLRIPLEEAGLKDRRMIDAACRPDLPVLLASESAPSIIPAGRPRTSCATLLRRILLSRSGIFPRASQ